MSEFAQLTKFLDQLTEPREFWWRDDDTGNDATALRHLLVLRHSLGVPLVVSTVPAWIDEATTAALRDERSVFVAQHGFDHCNHAGLGEKSIELGGRMAPRTVVRSIDQGRHILRAIFENQLLPLLVPPWNRIADAVLVQLVDIGFAAISTFARDRRGVACGLRHVNCHIDPILWRDGKRDMTPDELALSTINHLEQGRGRPTGLLTHHREWDAPSLEVLRDYLRIMSSHKNVIWPSPAQLFGAAT